MSSGGGGDARNQLKFFKIDYRVDIESSWWRAIFDPIQLGS